MIAALVLGAVLAASPTPPPSPVVAAPVPQPAMTVGCAHRAICGPIRLLPRDPAERRAFVARVILQAVDGVVTAAGLRAGRASYPDLATLARCYAGSGCDVARRAARLPPTFDGRPTAWEADPFVEPLSHGGLATLLLGGIAWDVTTSVAQRRWSAAQRTRFDSAEIGAHVAGIATWPAHFARRRALDGADAACAAWFARYGSPAMSGPAAQPGTPTLQVWGGVPAVPLSACQRFTVLPVVVR